MRVAVGTLLACALLASSVRAADKEPGTRASKLVGTWQFVKSKEKVPIPVGTTIELTRAGKLTMTIPGKDKEPPVRVTGTYKADGNKITTSLKGPDGKEMTETHTVKSVTATALVVEDKNGYVLEFKRKAAGGKVGKHEAVIKGMVEQLNALADALESVKDRDTAKAAAVKINKVCDRMTELGKEAKGLPKAPKEEDERLKAKYEGEMAKAARRLQATAVQAGRNSGGEPDFLKSLMRLQEVGKVLQSLGK